MKTIQCLFLLAALCAVGCAQMRVYDVSPQPGQAPVYPGKPGVRYCLPKPVLVVSPSPKGGGEVDVNVVLMPDDSHTYAIDADSLLSAYKLQVEVQNRLLTKVVFNPDNTGVAEAGITAAGEIAKAQMAAAQKQEAENEAEKKAQQDAMIKQFQSLTGEVSKKKEALEKAEAHLRNVISSGADEGKVAEARGAVESARIEYEAALLRLQDPAQYLVAGMLGAADEPQRIPKQTQAWGPVMFALNEELDEQGRPKLELKAGTFSATAGGEKAKQMQFPTVILPAKEEETPASTPTSPAGDFTKVTVKNLKTSDGTVSFTLQLNFPPIDISQQFMKDLGTNATADAKDLAVAMHKNEMTLDVSATGLKPGEYQFSVRVKNAKGEEIPITAPVEVK